MSNNAPKHEVPHPQLYPLRSQPVHSHPQPLLEYLRLALANNPELLAYQHDYLAAMERVRQAGGLPDPEVSLGVSIPPMQQMMGEQVVDLQLMQSIPWLGELRVRKDQASQMAVARYQMYRQVHHRVLFEVKSVWYRLVALNEHIRITEQSLEILRQRERIALQGLAAAEQAIGMGVGQSATAMGSGGNGMGAGGPGGPGGPASMGDVLELRAQVMGLERELAFLWDSKQPLQSQLNALLNREPDEPVSLADTLTPAQPTFDVPAMLDSLRQNNPGLIAMQAEAEAYQAATKSARLDGLPNVMIGIRYLPMSPRTENGVQVGGEDMLMPMLRLSLPLDRGKYTAQRNEAKHLHLAAEQRTLSTQHALTTQWSSAIRDWEDAVRRTTLYTQQMELTRRLLGLRLNAYSSDGRGFEQLLQVQRTLLDDQRMLIDALLDQHLSLAELERLAAVGGGEAKEWEAESK